MPTTLAIKSLRNDFIALCKQQPRYQALLAIPEFGPIVTAAFLSQVGSGGKKAGQDHQEW